jgi:dCTP deaminase
VVLSDGELLRAVKSGELDIEPFDPRLVQPASIDVRLGSDFLVLGGTPRELLDPRQAQDWMRPVLDASGALHLGPGDFALGATMECIGLPSHMSARFEGKSSIGRLGLLTHVTAGFVDPGFHGTITLELVNVTHRTWVLRPGMAIGQLSVTRLTVPAERPYGPERGSHYQGQVAATPSKVHEQMREAWAARAEPVA